MEIYRPTIAEINLDHLRHNVEFLQREFSSAPLLCPMIKANAYGHGDIFIAHYLEKLGIRNLGVCLLEEGLRLRQSGIKADILVFRGFDQEIGARELVRNRLTAVISDWGQIEQLEKVTTEPIEVHLKFDSGMNRIGFDVKEGQKLFHHLWQHKKIRLKAISTHLFLGEDALDPHGFSSDQLRKMQSLLHIFKPFNIYCHALNSAGIVNSLARKKSGQTSPLPLLEENWGLRPGLMIYGYHSLPEKMQCKLKGVMTLKSRVATYRNLRAGETVSYGATWKAQRNSVVAVVPIGYGDGCHRVVSNNAAVLFAGIEAPVIGTVCMDYLMLDVTDIVRGQDLHKFKDQEVTLFGQSREGIFLSPEKWASSAQTITWEVLTSVSERVPRVYHGMDADMIRDKIGG